MQDTTKVGKFVNEDTGYLADLRLNKLLNSILEKIRICDDAKEKKAFLKKLKLTRLEVFEDSAFIIDHILGSENYKEKIVELADKLNVFIDKKKITFESIVDFSNELTSKMKYHSTLVLRNVKDELTEDELRQVQEKMTDNDIIIVDKILADYNEWIEEVNDDKELYKFLVEYREKAKIVARTLVESTIKKLEADRTRPDRLYAMDVDREIKLYNQKHKSIHRVYNNVFE